MNFKNKYFIYLFCCLGTIAHPSLCTEYSTPDMLDIWMDEIEDNLDDILFDSLTAPGAAHTKDVTPIEAIEILIDILKADKLLQQELYLHTSQLRKRSLLDLPLFIEQRYIFPQKWTFGAHLFYNHMDRSNFTRNSENIESYLAITQDTLLDLLAELLPDIQDLDPDFVINPVDVLPLFAPMTIQQRRTGLMFHGMRKFEKFQLRFLWPLYYFERNFFLRQAEQDAVEAVLGVQDDDEFAEDHLISDALGFGDARIYLDFPMYERELIKSRVGILVTLPIAFALKKGLKGTNFKQGGPRPTFNFEALLDIENNAAESTKFLQDFALGALDQLSANLIEVELGNKRHLGIGLYTKSVAKLTPFIKRPWGEKVLWRSFMSLEYLLPAREKRYFVDITKAEEFERDWESVPDAEANLKFLGEKFVDKFYPFVFTTTVFPSFVFIWNSKLCYEGEKYAAFFGTDLWVTGPEKLRNIKAPADILRKLDVDKAKFPFAYQSKVLAGVTFTFNRPKRDWLLGLNIETTTIKSGIGYDWMATINLESHFG